jgi:aminoglycoside 6'-N-acetyltransferase I
MNMSIRKAKMDDKAEWARMRNILWPSDIQSQLADIEEYFSNRSLDIVKVFVLEVSPSKLGGFIELNIRNYAEGSDEAKVPFVEGWFVDKEFQNQGFGKQLIRAVEHWALEHGFRELASDSEIENTNSLIAHKAVGFKEASRVVCFIKTL